MANSLIGRDMAVDLGTANTVGSASGTPSTTTPRWQISEASRTSCSVVRSDWARSFSRRGVLRSVGESGRCS